MKKENKYLRHFLILISSSILIIIMGLFFVEMFAKNKEEEIKKDLFSRLETISHSIDANKMRDFTYTLEDEKTENYQILRNQLINAANVNKEFGVKWIYTVVFQEGKIVFSIDSDTDPDYSRPGDIYTDVDPEFYLAIKKSEKYGESTITKPYTDQWGTFISITSPIRDSKLGSTLGTIVIDIDYYNFYLKEINYVKSIVVDIFIIILFLYISLYLFMLRLYVIRRKINRERAIFKYAIEEAGDGFWDWTIKTNDIYLSPRWKKMLGYEDNEIKNNRDEWQSLIHPEDLSRVLDLIETYVKGSKDYFESTHRLKCKNGEYKWIVSKGRIVSYDKKGFPQKMVGIHIDVDKTKKIELELSQKVSNIEKIRTATLNILEDVAQEKDKFLKISNKLKLATESGNIGILELDFKENKMTGDNITNSIYGLPINTLQDISFEQWLTYVYPEDVSQVKKAVELCLKNNSNFNMTFRILLPNKKISYIKGYASVEKDEEGKPSKLVGVNIDITKDYEIDKAKTEFVSLASHQLKTPVGAISWNLEMLMDGDYGKLTKKQIDIIQETYNMNRRMADLVNGFLNISRIELGTFSIEPVVIDYKSICEEVLTELKLKIKEKNHVITKEYDELMPQTEADPRLLHILFQNILTNAIKYTPDNGKIDIYIGTNKNGILIKISNNGHVIPLEDQSNIFQRMFRASDAQSMDPNGNGLGLYLLKSIVEQAGGKIWFESKENIGTTFFVTFPLTGMKSKKGTKKII